MREEAFNNINDISLFDEGLIKYVCPKCHYILDISSKIVKCPICELSNEFKYVNFEIYPVLSAVDILYALYEFNNLASGKQKSIIKKIQTNLKSDLDKEFEFNKVKQILIDSCNIRNASGEMYLDKIKSMIARTLDLDEESNEDEVDKAYYIFLNGDNHNRLYKSAIFLTTTLIEILFKDYMSKFLTNKIDSITSLKIMDSLSYKSLDEHINQINIFFSKDLKHEMEEVEKSYYDKWKTLRDDRNKLIHKNEIEISSKRADEIFSLAKKSVMVFMKLNNRINM